MVQQILIYFYSMIVIYVINITKKIIKLYIFRVSKNVQHFSILFYINVAIIQLLFVKCN